MYISLRKIQIISMTIRDSDIYRCMITTRFRSQRYFISVSARFQWDTARCAFPPTSHLETIFFYVSPYIIMIGTFIRKTTDEYVIKFSRLLPHVSVSLLQKFVSPWVTIPKWPINYLKNPRTSRSLDSGGAFFFFFFFRQLDFVRTILFMVYCNALEFIAFRDHD